MNVNFLLVTVSLGLLSLSCQTFSRELTPAPDASTPTSSPSASLPPPQTQETESVEEESPLPIGSAVPLPRLTEAEIEAILSEVPQSIDAWFDLAGLSKMPAPPPLSETIRDYREAWSMVNVDAVTFLGSWHNGEDYPYSLSVFPSRTPGQVCVLEFQPEWSLDIFNEATGEYAKDVISEQILSFSIATIQDGHLRSSHVRSVGSATVATRFESYSVLFMGLIDDQGITRVVALSSPPTLPADLPENLVEPISQALLDHDCITDLAPHAG